MLARLLLSRFEDLIDVVHIDIKSETFLRYWLFSLLINVLINRLVQNMAEKNAHPSF